MKTIEYFQKNMPTLHILTAVNLKIMYYGLISFFFQINMSPSLNTEIGFLVHSCMWKTPPQECLLHEVISEKEIPDNYNRLCK